MVGRDLRVPDSLNRVVAITPSAAEFAVALGLVVVGRTTDAAFAPVASATTVGSSLAPDFNAIAALQPDLVIGDTAFDGARLQDFERFAYPVFLLKVSSYEDVLLALGALGDATGRVPQARDAATALAIEVDSLVQQFTGRPSPTVVILTGSGREVYAGSNQTYIGSLVKELGGTNLLAEAATGAPIAGFATVEVTAIASRNPSVVLTLASGSGGLAAQIIASPAWANSRAVKDRRVFELDTNAFLRAPGPGVLKALQTLADLLYAR
ncbi:MAG: ABC transporter substrate-binding protein [Anaerolineaceae bacterium]